MLASVLLHTWLDEHDDILTQRIALITDGVLGIVMQDINERFFDSGKSCDSSAVVQDEIFHLLISANMSQPS